MDCRNCGAAMGAQDAFCGNCGAQADAPPPPSTQPTQQMPQVARQPAPQPTPPPAAQPTQQMPQVAQTPGYPPSAYPPASQSGVPVDAPVKKRPNVALIVGLVVGGLLLLGLLGAAIIFGGLTLYRSSDDPVVAPVESESTTPPAAAPAEGVFATALEAAQSEVPDGYVIELAEEADARKVYWIGPPASEWEAIIVVEQADGGWRVTDTSAFNASAEGAGGDAAGATEAQQLVTGFLTAIKEDRPGDAQKSTISPFREDPASAAVSNGEFSQFSIDSVDPQDDGTFWVYTTEVWSWGTNQWRYDVVPTEAGLRIRNLEPVAP